MNAGTSDPGVPRSTADIAAAAQLACLLEASAPKPGNVSPGRSFADATYEEFLASAVAIGEPLRGAGIRPLGQTIRLAIEATSRWTRSNTNLGIVLLLAPLARAAILAADSDTGSVPEPVPEPVPSPSVLRPWVEHVLDEATVTDAREVYAAIRLAAPGGLGRAEAQDVADEPTLTLREVMRMAADRDGIAREYATGFERTFGAGAPSLARARADNLGWSDAVTETFLTLLAAAPDTHIARRGGLGLAEEVSARARTVLDAGGVRSERGRSALEDMDRALRDGGHTANPGTTADLTAAAVFVLLLIEGGWSPAARRGSAASSSSNTGPEV